MSERWSKAAISQNLPDTVVNNLAIELKRATAIEDMYSTTNTYTVDHRIGLPRGQISPMLYLAEGPAPENVKDFANINGDRDSSKNHQQDKQDDPTANQKTNQESEKEFYAVSKDNDKRRRKSLLAMLRNRQFPAGVPAIWKRQKYNSRFQRKMKKEKERKANTIRAIIKTAMVKANPVGTDPLGRPLGKVASIIMGTARMTIAARGVMKTIIGITIIRSMSTVITISAMLQCYWRRELNAWKLKTATRRVQSERSWRLI